MEGGEAVGHELGGYGQKHGGEIIEVQAGSEAADDAKEKADGDAGEEEEVDHALQDKIVLDLPLIIN
jgi:hypothetical protein